MERNEIVDVVRGIAMLLVVLGHTITGTVLGDSDSILFKIIWSLQMPLFFIVSGYITRYSKPLITGSSLRRFIKKRSCAYLIPWVIWTIGIRGLILNQSNFLNIKYLLWHMDTGYWFLVSLWTIVIFYGIADWLTAKCKARGAMGNIGLHLLLMVVAMVILACVGRITGIAFLSIKLTLYYLPLYMGGYVFGQLQDTILNREKTHDALMLTVTVATGVWLFLIMRYNFFNVDMTVRMLILRYMCSIMGAIAIVGCLWTICHCADFNYRKDFKLLMWSGQNSLAIYLTHYIYLPLCFVSSQLEGMGALTIPLILLKYILVLFFTIVTIRLLDANRMMRKLLFWK